MKKILLIEDEPNIRDAFKLLLSRNKFKVYLASNGEEGLAQALKHEPDLILLDILMPVMNGLEFLKEYRPKENHPDVKVVMLTNVEEPFYSAMELGAKDYIVKSDVSGRELISQIKQILAR